MLFIASQDEATALAHGTGFRSAVGAPNPDEIVEEVLARITSKSKTASEILQVLNCDSTPIYIAVIQNQGDSVFDAKVDDKKPVVFFRNDKLPFFAPKRQAAQEVPAELVLIHELGHAKQWVEDPDYWNKMENYSKQAPVVKVSKWGDPQRGPTSRLGLAGGFDVAIEYDNLTRHEFPICDEIGYAKRDNYLDYCRSADVAKQRRGKANLRRLKQLVLHEVRSHKAS